jgi:hypothetical protein
LQIRLDTSSVTSHHIGRHPSRVLKLRLDLLSAHLLSNVRDADPQHANGKQMVSGPVVYSDFDLVRLVDCEVVYLVQPFVVPRRLGAPLDGVLHLDVDECLRASTKTPGSCVVNVGDLVDA